MCRQRVIGGSTGASSVGIRGSSHPGTLPAKSGAREMSLRQMRGQGMIGGLVEEGGFLGGGFQELLVLVVDVVAELDGLVAF
jgi:hypothetical protein